MVKLRSGNRTDKEELKLSARAERASTRKVERYSLTEYKQLKKRVKKHDLSGKYFPIYLLNALISFNLLPSISKPLSFLLSEIRGSIRASVTQNSKVK